MKRSQQERQKTLALLDELRDYLRAWLATLFIQNVRDFEQYVKEDSRKKETLVGKNRLSELDAQGLFDVFKANSSTLKAKFRKYGLDEQVIGYVHAVNCIRNKYAHSSSIPLPHGRFEHDVLTIKMLREALEEIKFRFFNNDPIGEKVAQISRVKELGLKGAFINAMDGDDVEMFDTLFCDERVKGNPEYLLDDEGTSIWVLWNRRCKENQRSAEYISSSEITKRLLAAGADEYTLLKQLYVRGGCDLLEKVADSRLKINARSALGLSILDEVYQNETENKIEKITALRKCGYRFGFNPFDPLLLFQAYYDQNLLKEKVLDCIDLGLSKAWGARLMFYSEDDAEEGRSILTLRVLKQKEIPNHEYVTPCDYEYLDHISAFITLEDMLNDVPIVKDEQIRIRVIYP